MSSLRIIKLIGNGWYKILKDEFKKEYMHDIAEFLKKERKKYTIYPKTNEGIFSVYRNTPFYSVNVVILGQDPYANGAYHGMAFSNRNDYDYISPSLKNILKEVEDDIYHGLNLNEEKDLTRWQEQGVFLLNRVLTVRAGKPGSHFNIGWEHFTTQTIIKLSELKDNIVFMLWGNKAKEMKKYIDQNKHLVLESGHPSPLSANKGLWFGNKHFSKCNKFLKEHNKNEIIW